MPDTQYGLPLIVDNLNESAARGLKRIRLEKGTSDDTFKERWLQKLVSRYPNVLPIDQIEPAITDVVPICMELPLPSGYVDNLYATPDGDLIVGETHPTILEPPITTPVGCVRETTWREQARLNTSTMCFL